MEAYSSAYAKGQDSDEEGLELATCFDPAGKAGLQLKALAAPGGGTEFRLSAPVAAEV